MAIEIVDLPTKAVIFDSYVSLPEGMLFYFFHRDGDIQSVTLPGTMQFSHQLTMDDQGRFSKRPGRTGKQNSNHLLLSRNGADVPPHGDMYNDDIELVGGLEQFLFSTLGIVTPND